jgi:hypothetical protein
LLLRQYIAMLVFHGMLALVLVLPPWNLPNLLVNCNSC